MGYDAATPWQGQLSARLNSEDLGAVLQNMPVLSGKPRMATLVTPYVAQQMDENDPNCPIRLQYIPTEDALVREGFESVDELGEDGDTVPGTSVVHRYPQRVLFLTTNVCGSFCTYCTRSRIVSQPGEGITKSELEASLDYIEAHTEIQDVLLSGGDPLLMPDHRLDYILSAIRSRAPHVKFLRIGSRLPVQLPTRITPELCAVLERNSVQMLNLHINHVKEITPLFVERLKLLYRTGIMLGNQTVLLRGVNDSEEVLRDLCMELVSLRIRPYYVYATDPVVGAKHFIVSLARMKELYRGLRGWISGPAIPNFVVDGAGGLGKLPVISDYVEEVGDTVRCTNFKGETVDMPWLK